MRRFRLTSRQGLPLLAYGAFGLAALVFGPRLSDAVVSALGDKAAHGLAAFLLCLPGLLAVRMKSRAWLAFATLSVVFVPLSLESSSLGLSQFYDGFDILAGSAGALAAVGSSVASTAVLPDCRWRADARRVGRATSVLLSMGLLVLSIATASAIEGAFELAEGEMRTLPDSGYIEMQVGQQLTWSWSSGYVNFWLEEESSGTFYSVDDNQDSGCFEADFHAFVRARWEHPTSEEQHSPHETEYDIDVVNGTADCPTSISEGLAGQVPSKALAIGVWLGLVIVVAIAVVAVTYWTWKRWAPRPPSPPPPK